MTFKEKSHTTYIPVYDVWFEVVVSNDVKRSRHTKKRVKLFGEFNPTGGYSALASCRNSNLAIFLNSSNVSHSTIAHEVFHTTHHLMEIIGDNFNYNNQEPAAYLNGYLTSLVYNNLKEWGVKPR